MYVLPQYPRFRFLVIYSIRFYTNKGVKINSNLLSILKEMPKEPKHILEAQRQRIKIKQKSSKYVPGKVCLQILGTGAKGSPRAVYLFSDQSRYLFNCGEGTQRLAHEHKIKLAKLEHIFLTQTTWKNVGGLPGTALTIQDVGVPKITLHGPPGLNELFSATRRFVVLRDLKIEIAECTENNIFEDNVVSIKYVPIIGKPKNFTLEQIENSSSNENMDKAFSSSNNNDTDDTDYYAHECKGGVENIRSVSPTIQHLLQDNKERGIAMSYICRLKHRPGALNLDKCVFKGVPPGPLLGKLKNGEDITLPNGNVVRSSEVCDPDDPGPVFLVIDCPSEQYLDTLINNAEIKKHQKFAGNDNDVTCVVVHFTPTEILKLPKYQRWMDDFILSTEHILVNEANLCLGSIAVHRIQYKLNMLSPNLFPLLNDQGMVIEGNSDILLNKRPKCDSVNTIKSENGNIESNNLLRKDIGTLCKYHLRPKKGFDDYSQVRLDPQEYINETMVLPDFPAALNELKEKIRNTQMNLTIRNYPKILFLGTGSCIPNKTRNTSGILLQTSETQNIVLDCGEGTYGQIIRFYGLDESDKVLSNIDAIYISHLHADHHIGLIGLLQGRKRARQYLNLPNKAVYLFAPRQILGWLNFYDQCFEDIKEEFILIPNGDLILHRESYPKDDKKDLLGQLNLNDFKTCQVKHCPNAFGVALVLENGCKITYSGDTMPTENLIELGKLSDVLIHEATMEDDLAREAIIKMHSTTSQAIKVGNDMGAKYIILTHFSQRYAKLPRFNENFAENVGIAFDNMLVKVDELPLVPLLYPALKIMFAEHYEEMEQKAVKRQLKSEILAAQQS
ncbi:ribonuclease Z isoform X1 [Rhynchophorus ferrugineus]|uniref:ribonuclease Z isoform X1 n=2 Tax=Rhynchophorus ferrugineus TaxID=354439 RepID=UPI003FCE6582